MPLEGEHLFPRFGLTVVVAEQVEESVDGQQQDLVHRRMTCRPSLSLGDLGADDDVAHLTFGRLLRLALVELIHGKGHHVGWSFEVHPGDVEFGHGR